MATPTYLLPIWNGTQFFDNNGNVLNGGQIFTYEGGSYSVQQTTYQGTDVSSPPNPQPIVLDGDGRMPSQMWGQQGLYYNLTLLDSNGNLLDQQPNIIGIEPSFIPSSGGSAISVWNSTTAPTYVSGTQFLVPGNLVNNFAVGNRVQFINGVSVYGYGTVVAVSYSSPNTQVTLENDSTAIGTNISAVYWSALVSNGITVDADAVSYASDITYSNLATVGGQIANLYSTLTTDIANVDAGLLDRAAVYVTGGTYLAGGTSFTLTPTPAAISLTVNESYDVEFNVAGGLTPTLNISGLGAIPLVQLNSAGSYVSAIVAAGQTTRVLYDGTAYVVQNAVPSNSLVNAQIPAFTNSVPGSATFPSGLIIKWGTLPYYGDSAYHAQVFAVPFPNACFGIYVQPYQSVIASAITGAGTSVQAVQGLTRTGFNFIMSSNWNVGSSGPQFYWAAIGY